MVGLLDEKQRPNLHYDLVDHRSGINYGKPKMGWRYEPETMKRLINEDRILFPKTVSGRPRRKVFLSELQSEVTGFSSIVGEAIFTRNGTNAIQSIFGDRIFEFSKPYELIQSLINQVADVNDIILDSFAGSGTTGHAVLDLNKQDGGNRKFILVEMGEYAETITAERMKRVIRGYGNSEGTGGDFAYYTLGSCLFLENNNLNEDVGTDKIRRYIYYSETKQSISISSPETDHASLLGLCNNSAYYFHYKKNELTTLNLDFLGLIKSKADQYIIYADNCLLDKDFMLKHNIVFKKIPRDITRF